MKFKDLEAGDKFIADDSEAHFMKIPYPLCNCIVIQEDEKNGFPIGYETMTMKDEEVTKIVYTGMHQMEDK